MNKAVQAVGPTSVECGGSDWASLAILYRSVSEMGEGKWMP